MTRGDLFLAEVRTWIGTPFHPHAAAKGAGADCKGLLWGAARELDFPEAQTTYAEFIDYNLSKPNGIPSDHLLEGMGNTFRRVKRMKPGDILLLDHNRKPGHLAVYAGDDKAIHTQISSKAWVKETSLRALFHYYPLNSIWRWK